MILEHKGCGKAPLQDDGFGSACLDEWVLSGMTAMQSLDVSHISTMTAKGLRALGTLTQLTALNANCIGLSFETGPMRGTEHVPNVLRVHSRLTGAAP